MTNTRIVLSALSLMLLPGDRAFFVTGETEAGGDVKPAMLQAVGAELVAAESG